MPNWKNKIRSSNEQKSNSTASNYSSRNTRKKMWRPLNSSWSKSGRKTSIKVIILSLLSPTCKFPTCKSKPSKSEIQSFSSTKTPLKNSKKTKTSLKSNWRKTKNTSPNKSKNCSSHWMRIRKRQKICKRIYFPRRKNSMRTSVALRRSWTICGMRMKDWQTMWRMIKTISKIWMQKSISFRKKTPLSKLKRIPTTKK